jgi:hypothetical protein
MRKVLSHFLKFSILLLIFLVFSSCGDIKEAFSILDMNISFASRQSQGVHETSHYITFRPNVNVLSHPILTNIA